MLPKTFKIGLKSIPGSFLEGGPELENLFTPFRSDLISFWGPFLVFFHQISRLFFGWVSRALLNGFCMSFDYVLDDFLVQA